MCFEGAVHFTIWIKVSYVHPLLHVAFQTLETDSPRWLLYKILEVPSRASASALPGKGGRCGHVPRLVYELGPLSCQHTAFQYSRPFSDGAPRGGFLPNNHLRKFAFVIFHDAGERRSAANIRLFSTRD